MMDSRAEFESWAKRAKNSPNDFIDEFFDRYSLPEDHYKLPWVSVSWEGWKASRQALEGECNRLWARVTELEQRENAMCSLNYANGARQGFVWWRISD